MKLTRNYFGKKKNALSAEVQDLHPEQRPAGATPPPGCLSPRMDGRRQGMALRPHLTLPWQVPGHSLTLTAELRKRPDSREARRKSTTLCTEQMDHQKHRPGFGPKQEPTGPTCSNMPPGGGIRDRTSTCQGTAITEPSARQQPRSATSTGPRGSGPEAEGQVAEELRSLLPTRPLESHENAVGQRHMWKLLSQLIELI